MAKKPEDEGREERFIGDEDDFEIVTEEDGDESTADGD